jgi:exonuclease III
MSTTLRIVSWNIAGSRKMKSLDHFDYEEEDITYFADQIKALSPDIVCLQETHTNAQRIIANEIARKAGFEYVYNHPVSPSHIDNSYRLGYAVLSKVELKDDGVTYYPYPDFPLFFSDGRPAEVHQKGVQLVVLNGLAIANTQMLPLPVFGKTYESGDGALLAQKIDASLSTALKQPLIFCGDFNFDEPQALYPKTYKAYGLRDALPDMLTRPNKEGLKKRPDHILYSSGVTCIDAKIVTVQADHYLCYADFSIN